jgi:hypothetical protein
MDHETVQRNMRVLGKAAATAQKHAYDEARNQQNEVIHPGFPRLGLV